MAPNGSCTKKGRALSDAGHDVIELTIGEPDVPVPDTLIETAISAIQMGRTKYADGQGEIGLRTVLADHYSTMSGRPIDEVLVCDPMTQRMKVLSA